jgi:hypothetical protein
MTIQIRDSISKLFSRLNQGFLNPYHQVSITIEEVEKHNQCSRTENACISPSEEL